MSTWTGAPTARTRRKSTAYVCAGDAAADRPHSPTARCAPATMSRACRRRGHSSCSIIITIIGACNMRLMMQAKHPDTLKSADQFVGITAHALHAHPTRSTNVSMGSMPIRHADMPQTCPNRDAQLCTLSAHTATHVMHVVLLRSHVSYASHVHSFRMCARTREHTHKHTSRVPTRPAMSTAALAAVVTDSVAATSSMLPCTTHQVERASQGHNHHATQHAYDRTFKTNTLGCALGAPA